MTESIMKGGWILSCVILPILLLAHALLVRTLTLGAARSPYETMMAQITEERLLNSHECEPTPIFYTF